MLVALLRSGWESVIIYDFTMTIKNVLSFFSLKNGYKKMWKTHPKVNKETKLYSPYTESPLDRGSA